MSELSKVPYGDILSPISLLSFWPGPYLPNCYCPLSSWYVKQLPLIILDKGPGDRIFPAEQVLSSTQAFPGNHKTGQIGTMLWEWDFLRRSKQGLSSPVVAMLLVFTCTMFARLLVFKVTVDLKRGICEQFKLQCHKPCLMRFSSFSWINTSQIVGRLWLISRVLKKLILAIFASVFIAFMEEWIYPHWVLKA